MFTNAKSHLRRISHLRKREQVSRIRLWQVQDVELVRKVGQGAFGVVYHARVHQTDYACKSGPQNCTNHVLFFKQERLF